MCSATIVFRLVADAAVLCSSGPAKRGDEHE